MLQDLRRLELELFTLPSLGTDFRKGGNRQGLLEFYRGREKRRTTRVSKPDLIPDEFISKVIEATHWAPTGSNTQPFEFVVVKDKKTSKK
jgi:hypothetical protein